MFILVTPIFGQFVTVFFAALSAVIGIPLLLYYGILNTQTGKVLCLTTDISFIANYKPPKKKNQLTQIPSGNDNNQVELNKNISDLVKKKPNKKTHFSILNNKKNDELQTMILQLNPEAEIPGKANKVTLKKIYMKEYDKKYGKKNNDKQKKVNSIPDDLKEDVNIIQNNIQQQSDVEDADDNAEINISHNFVVNPDYLQLPHLGNPHSLGDKREVDMVLNKKDPPKKKAKIDKGYKKKKKE